MNTPEQTEPLCSSVLRIPSDNLSPFGMRAILCLDQVKKGEKESETCWNMGIPEKTKSDPVHFPEVALG